MSDQTILLILIKNGRYNDFVNLSLITSGAVAMDMEVRIFAMNDAVWALKKNIVGTDTRVHSHFPSFSEEISKSMGEGIIIPWWELLSDLKKMGDVKITACALITDATHIKKEDLHDLVDEISGIASFVADMENSNHVISI